MRKKDAVNLVGAMALVLVAAYPLLLVLGYTMGGRPNWGIVAGLMLAGFAGMGLVVLLVYSEDPEDEGW